jgi:vacuolar-type H+-ATPase subunit E/Vma4
MSRELSPQVERYLASVVAGGLFPSEEAALEAAIAALREKIEPISSVPDEHVELIEQGIASLRAGRCRVFTDADWENLRQLARGTDSAERARSPHVPSSSYETEK